MRRKSGTRNGGTLNRRDSMRVLIAAVLGTVSISFAHGAARKWTEEARTVKIERAIEILNPEHREHYESLVPVNTACRMGMEALEKQMPKKPITDSTHYAGFEEFLCPSCKKRIISRLDGDWLAGRLQKYCDECGQALDWSDT